MDVTGWIYKVGNNGVGVGTHLIYPVFDELIVNSLDEYL